MRHDRTTGHEEAGEGGLSRGVTMLSTCCPPLRAFACRVEWVLTEMSPPMGMDSNRGEMMTRGDTNDGATRGNGCLVISFFLHVLLV